ncbi:virion structural protein [Pseudomonas phage PhiPA3]|uniref:Virion structural protein n=1 Tax=Pseudomonas phage PhiPA3 TaxID=998086 RepID=F8SJX2_BPPA3|nr:virion structural protein [Pseudomonas phage PhiPA3]AEH03517.1 virion structural protein [Pseudomonas phage PhiPA3]
MSLLTYVRSLAPVIERRDLMNIIDNLELEYEDTLAPILADVREAFGGRPLKSMLARRMDVAMRRNVNFSGSVVDVIINSLTNVKSAFEFLRRETRALFSVQFTNSNLTFDRANLLKFVEALAFYVRYGRKFLLYVVGQEAATVGKATISRWTSAENEWIESNMSQFTALFPTMNLPGSELKSRMSRASSATIDDSTFQLAQGLGAAKTDPLNLSGFSPRQNPFLIIGKLIAEMQAERYKNAKEEYFGLQLRLQELRELAAGGQANPQLQREIEAYERRASSYEFEIAQIEEKAGIAS